MLVGCGGSDSTALTGERDAATQSDAAPELYADLANWLCLPGKAGDVCKENLDATIWAAPDTKSLEPHPFAINPPVDCFYVYPTISNDATPNSDLVPGDQETGVVKIQAARLTSVCDVYAPVYRQVTLPALFGTLPPEAGAPDRELAYSDAAAAWDYYMAHHNKGRGVVLIGHSQGAGILKRLVQERFDADAAMRSKLVAAYLIGGGIAVPAGADVGQDFQNIPLCRTTSQTACVVAYSSFRSTAPPPADSLFGKPRNGGPGVTACNNPAALAGGPATLKPYFPTSTGIVPLQGASSITTPYVTLPDFLTGECVVSNGFSYLQVTINADSSDPRPDDIGGDLTPPWGLHLVDVHLAMGDIENLVRSQIASFSPP